MGLGFWVLYTPILQYWRIKWKRKWKMKGKLGLWGSTEQARNLLLQSRRKAWNGSTLLDSNVEMLLGGIRTEQPGKTLQVAAFALFTMWQRVPENFEHTPHKQVYYILLMSITCNSAHSMAQKMETIVTQ